MIRKRNLKPLSEILTFDISLARILSTQNPWIFIEETEKAFDDKWFHNFTTIFKAEILVPFKISTVFEDMGTRGHSHYKSFLF